MGVVVLRPKEACFGCEWFGVGGGIPNCSGEVYMVNTISSKLSAGRARAFWIKLPGAVLTSSR